MKKLCPKCHIRLIKKNFIAALGVTMYACPNGDYTKTI